MNKDYYAILQVAPNAEQIVIDAAYRRLAQKYHPDTSKDSDSSERMILLNEAYAVLGKPERRAQYDQTRQGNAKTMFDPTDQIHVNLDSTTIVMQDWIVLGGSKIVLPCSLRFVSGSIGTPSRMFRLKNNVYVWDELGIMAYEPPAGEIDSVLLAFGRKDLLFWPKNLYTLPIRVGSYVLNGWSNENELTAAGFAQEKLVSSIWQRQLRKFSLLIETEQGMQRIVSVEISAKEQRTPVLLWVKYRKDPLYPAVEALLRSNPNKNVNDIQRELGIERERAVNLMAAVVFNESPTR